MSSGCAFVLTFHVALFLLVGHWHIQGHIRICNREKEDLVRFYEIGEGDLKWNLDSNKCFKAAVLSPIPIPISIQSCS